MKDQEHTYSMRQSRALPYMRMIQAMRQRITPKQERAFSHELIHIRLSKSQIKDLKAGPNRLWKMIFLYQLN